ncbi:MAG: glycosyltransferase family 4 protein [bacterium]
MRILEMITPSRIGGAETHVARLVRDLRAVGDEVTVFSPAGRPFTGYLQEQELQPVSWRTSGKIDPISIYRTVKLIRQQNIEVVHTHLTSATFIGAQAARITGIPCVATLHGFTDAFWYRLPPRLIAVSQAVKAHFVAQGIPESRITVLHNGINLAEYLPCPLEEAKIAIGQSPDGPIVGVFGRLAPEKGQDVALDALVQVVRAIPDVRLLIVGEGRCHTDLFAQAERLGIGANVEFCGFHADPRPLMRACDVVLVPSRKEGFGLAAIEAMALARPVVATRVGGLPEVVADGTTGTLVPPESPAALAAAIVELLQNPARATAMGQAGNIRVAGNFDQRRQLQLLRGVFGGEIGS